MCKKALHQGSWLIIVPSPSSPQGLPDPQPHGLPGPLPHQCCPCCYPGEKDGFEQAYGPDDNPVPDPKDQRLPAPHEAPGVHSKKEPVSPVSSSGHGSPKSKFCSIQQHVITWLLDKSHSANTLEKEGRRKPTPQPPACLSYWRQ